MAEDAATTTTVRQQEIVPPLWLITSEAFVGGWIAGAAGILVGHPFDTVKTLQQAVKDPNLGTQETGAKTPKAFTLLSDVVKGYGVKGLYRGLAYPLLTYGSVNAAFFTAAEHTRFWLINQNENVTDRLSYLQIFGAGCVGGVAQLGVVCPSELIKTKLQVQLDTGKKLYKGPWDCTKKLWRQQGILAYFKGMTACFYRDTYAWGVYLLTYEAVKDYLMDHHKWNYIGAELIAGGSAGATGWAVATPFDVIKTRIQASEHQMKLWPTITALYREGGLKIFSRGIVVSSLRGIPSNAVTLFGFAEIMRWCEHYNKEFFC